MSRVGPQGTAREASDHAHPRRDPHPAGRGDDRGGRRVGPAVGGAAGRAAAVRADDGPDRDLRGVPVLGWMTLVHAAIGVGEALITGLVLRSLLLTRPDLVADADAAPTPRSLRLGQEAAAGLGIALAVATFLAPLTLSWDRPDGLEYV